MAAIADRRTRALHTLWAISFRATPDQNDHGSDPFRDAEPEQESLELTARTRRGQTS